MDYQQTLNASKRKRILGLVLGILALLSIIVSLLKFFYLRMTTGTELGAVLAEPYRNLISAFYEHTAFLNFFWEYSPVPDLVNIIAVENFYFLVVYMFFFVGLALEASGDKISSCLSANLSRAGGGKAEDDGSDLTTLLESTGVRVLDQHRELVIIPAITIVVALVVLKIMGF